MKTLKTKLILVFLLLANVSFLFAQQQALPIDPKVRYGKLDNGLTYYIRHNELPKERAEFFIAQKVGSVLEDDSQAGLAHFLEHMAFNGSKNLPGKTMINYLEKIGVKFGENLNAYTGFDRTVYNVSNVPVTRQGIIDTCLLVLHDWSSFISLEETEIDKERGVIREEMRSGGEADFRQIEKLLPQIMPGSQYAKRLPIGTAEIIENFKYQELRDYYHKWYRPDLQGIIVIGDIDVDQIEAKIKTMFADIPKPVNPAERVTYPVPNNTDPIVGIVGDKEATYTEVDIYFKHDIIPDEIKASAMGIGFNVIKSAISQMLNMRFQEMQQKPNAPFNYAGGRDGNFIVAQTKDCFTAYGIAKEGQIENTLKSVTTEVMRVKKFGFTASEFERAKANILKSYETSFKEKDKQQNRRYAQEYVAHFTTGGSIAGIDKEYELVNQIMPAIKVEQINGMVSQLIGDENIVLSLTYPEKEGFTPPTKEQLLSWFNEAKSAKIEAYVDKVSNEPLMAKLPTPGKIVSTKEDTKFGATVFTLSNGVKVVAKSTIYKDDEISMTATSPGGSSLFPESEMTNIKLYGSVVGVGGVGNFSRVDLTKVLAGKRASVYPTINLTTEGFGGSSSVKDIETMLQLINLYFTAPRMDEEAYQAFIGRMKSQLESAEIDPMNAFSDLVSANLNENTARSSRLKPNDLSSLNYQTVMNWYKDRYKDASDFTFVFVGKINMDTIKPLIERYLGSLPSIKRKETFKDTNSSFKVGTFDQTIEKPVQNPKVTVFDALTATIEPTLTNRMKMSMLTQILRIVYTEKVREDEGGTYGVSVGGSILTYPKVNTLVQVYYETSAEKKDKLNEIIMKEAYDMATNGPRMEDFNKVKEFMVKKQKENEQENSYWMNSILSFYADGYDGYTEYNKTLESITPADIQSFAKRLMDQNNVKVMIFNGVKAEK